MFGIAALALLTLVCFQLGLGSSPTVFLYLIVIVLLSLRGTFVPLATLSVVAVTSLNYFFVPPVFTFRVESPVDAVELGAFLITVLVITRVVSRSRLAEERSAERAQLLNLTHDTIFVTDMEGVIKYWNRGSEERYGWTAEQALGRVVHDLLKTVSAPPLEQVKAEVTRTGRWEGELVHTKADGTQIVVASRWALRRDERGAPVAILETNNDITERKRAEERIQQHQMELRQVLDVAPQLVAAFGPDRKRLYANQPALDYFGVTLEGWQSISDRFWFFHPDDRERVANDVYTGAESDVPHEFEARLRRKDGTYRWFLFRDNPLRDEQARITRWYLSAADIEDRKQTEQALRESEANLNRAQEVAHIGSWYLDIARNQLTWSNEVYRIFDRRIGTALGYETFLDMVHPEDRERVDRAWVAALQGAPYDIEHRVLIGNELKWVRERAAVEFDPQGKAVKGIGIVQDITDRKRAGEALQQSEAYLAESQRLTHTGSWAFDLASNKYVYLSEECSRIFELDGQEGVPTREAISRLIHPEDWDRVNGDFEKSIREKVDISSEFRITLPSGTAKHIHAIRHPVLNDAGDIVQLVGTAIDITERKRAEEERERLRQLEADLTHINRVSMMGEVAASIAHEVNQPLTAIVNNANACLGLLPGGSPRRDELREALADIVSDAERGSAIIERVRGMAKRSAPERVPLQLADVVKDIVALTAKEAAARHASIYQDVPADLPAVLGDRVQLQQVLLNLVVNAMDAMSSVEEAQRRIEIQGKPDIHEGRPAVVISVRDRGIGFKGAETERLFEAFYTTKSHGMGLGLAISRSVIKAHGGRMWAKPNQGPGMTFCCSLPAAASPP